MKKVLESITFWAGFASSFVLFIIINFIDLIQQSARLCFDCDNGYGKPFRIYESGSMIHRRGILWSGLLADIVVAIVVNTIIGLIFYFLAAKLLKRSPLK